MNTPLRHTRILLAFGSLCLVLGLTQCGNSTETSEEAEPKIEKTITVQSNLFSSDSAYRFIEQQIAFGFRIPGTSEHKNCADWLYSQLLKNCDTAYYQKGQTQTHTSKTIPVYNLIGSFNPKASKRILLGAHWDSRPIADQDRTNSDKPIVGANDGASGVGVLLEISRILDTLPSDMGLDIIFFDAEDLGASEVENSFCLGSQYWAKNPHIPNYSARMGVLLDMVGGKDAAFLWESNSNQWGNFLLSHVWSIAQDLGYQTYFKTQNTGMVIDDHVYVYKGRGIPMIDIIDYNQDRGFPEQWHTHDDDITHIHKPTLKAVGHTLENLLNNPPPSLRY